MPKRSRESRYDGDYPKRRRMSSSSSSSYDDVGREHLLLKRIYQMMI